MHKITAFDFDLNSEAASITLTVTLPRSEVRQRIDRMQQSYDETRHPGVCALSLVASEAVSDILRRHNL